MTSKIEYRVRPITRYIVTRYEENLQSGAAGSVQCGEYDNVNTAYAVGYALCAKEHNDLGLPLDTPLLRYPDRPDIPLDADPRPLA